MTIGTCPAHLGRAVLGVSKVAVDVIVDAFHPFSVSVRGVRFRP